MGRRRSIDGAGPVIGTVAVRRHRTHVTETFMATLAPHLGREIERSLRSLDVR